MYLRDNKKVVFVACLQQYPHYLAVMKKLGINLQTSIDDGSLIYIDAFTQPFSMNSFDNLPISTKIPNTHTLKVPKNLHKFSIGASDISSSFDELYELLPEDSVLVFDNLSSLLQGMETETPDLDLAEVLNQMQCHPNLVVGLNRDLLFGNQKTIFREYKNNCFNYVFDVNRNEAGYNSRDVHG
jgi:KaiC/GvpD/RAD55 family RecA-like ATPase